MVKFLIIVGLIVLSIFLIYCFAVHCRTKKEIISRFKTGNCVVSGRKGYGKDVLFSYVINKRKDDYFANLDYTDNEKFNLIAPKQLELAPNTYENFINGKVTQIQKIQGLEGKDIYFSDGGCIFPSQADSILHKTYPSLPLFFALNRHLYNNGMHINAQRLDRIWKALREQADTYILIRKRRLKLPFFIVIYTTLYDKYESALHELNPLNSRMFNKFSKAEKDKYKATNGYIKNGFIFVRKKSLRYDSRAFHKIVFGYSAPQVKRLIFRRKNEIDFDFSSEN